VDGAAALAIAFAVAGGIELTRWLLKRRRPPGAANRETSLCLQFRSRRGERRG
jgi:hypothetical protein